MSGDFCVDSNSALSLRFHSSESRSDQVPALFTHHFFEDEKIYGYKNLSITLEICRHSLDTFYKIKFDEEMELETLKVNDIKGVFEHVFGFKLLESEEEFHKALQTPIEKLGKKEKAFEIGSKKFSVNLLDAEATDKKNILQKLQGLNHLFIEDASHIDFNDKNWESYIIYFDDKEGFASIAGFMSVFNFFAFPNKKRKRISQFIILPEYQRIGLGTELLKIFYKRCQSDDWTQDFTVEEPNSEFTQLRDKLDFSLISKDQNLPVGRLTDFLQYLEKEYKYEKAQALKLYKMMKIFQTLKRKECIDSLEKDLLDLFNKHNYKIIARVESLKDLHPDINLTIKDSLYSFIMQFRHNFSELKQLVMKYDPSLES
ncbi:MAG: histone acetyltransferase 1 [Paramarteilia canceri]